MKRFKLDPNNLPTFSEAARRRLDAMTENEIEAMAGDPDEGTEPMSDEMLDRAVVGRRIRMAREALGIGHAEFAARFHLPFPALRDWEEGRVMPDEAMAAYLKVIARETAAVDRALAAA